MPRATSSTTPRLNLLPDFPGRKLIYRPLDSGTSEIRVIVVLHAAEREAPLRCFLKTISIHEGKSTEPYHALSYYWGSTENPETVEVYGGSWGYRQFGGSFKTPITSNCALALRQFRAEATAERQRLVIWTDALCINQTDTEERSAQAGIMRDIYKDAHSVWMWIGGESLAAEAALHFLYLRANDTQRSKIFTEVCPNARLDWMAAMQIEAAKGIEDNFEDMRQQNIAVFASATYWQRGWIIQEATANDNTYMCYGPARYRIISWKLLAKLVEALCYEYYISVQPIRDFLTRIYQLRIFHRAWSLLGNLSTGQAKQLRIRRSECVFTGSWLFTTFSANSWHTSDARDRVNAIMSAMPFFFTSGFQPDYSKSVEEVFISATVHLLGTARSWSHLQFLAPSGSPYLPSWTIDFTAALPFLPSPDASESTGSWAAYFSQLFLHVMRTYGPSNSAENARFGADAKTPFRLRQVNQEVLETAGLFVDELVSVSPLFTATLDLKDEGRGLRAWYRFLNQNKRYTRRNTTLCGRARKWEAFCRTLCIARVGKLKFDVSHASSSEALWDMVIHDRQIYAEGMREKAEELYYEMVSSLMGARFVVTRRGRIGVAPRNVAAGDSIAILAAGDVPFVLRNVKAEDVPGDPYILIGGCYIDGKPSGAPSCTSTADSKQESCSEKPSKRKPSGDMATRLRHNVFLMRVICILYDLGYGVCAGPIGPLSTLAMRSFCM
jgi:hypothetical protein